MNYDYRKRSYLLPEGCKDLIDALQLGGTAEQKEISSLPPITEVIALPNAVSVKELALRLDRKPFQVVADLMTLGVFASLEDPLEFDLASRVVRKYGYFAERTP